MATELKLDPLAVRRANYLTAPTFTDNDLMVNSYGLPQCVDWVEQRVAGGSARTSCAKTTVISVKVWDSPVRITSAAPPSP